MKQFPWYFSLSELMVIPEISCIGIVNGLIGLFGCSLQRQSRATFAGFDHQKLHSVALRSPLQELRDEISRDFEVAAFSIVKTVQIAAVTGPSSRARRRKTRRLVLERLSISVPDMHLGDGARVLDP